MPLHLHEHFLHDHLPDEGDADQDRPEDEGHGPGAQSKLRDHSLGRAGSPAEGEVFGALRSHDFLQFLRDHSKLSRTNKYLWTAQPSGEVPEHCLHSNRYCAAVSVHLGVLLDQQTIHRNLPKESGNQRQDYSIHRGDHLPAATIPSGLVGGLPILNIGGDR